MDSETPQHNDWPDWRENFLKEHKASEYLASLEERQARAKDDFDRLAQQGVKDHETTVRYREASDALIREYRKFEPGYSIAYRLAKERQKLGGVPGDIRNWMLSYETSLAEKAERSRRTYVEQREARRQREEQERQNEEERLTHLMEKMQGLDSGRKSLHAVVASAILSSAKIPSGVHISRRFNIVLGEHTMSVLSTMDVLAKETSEKKKNELLGVMSQKIMIAGEALLRIILQEHCGAESERRFEKACMRRARDPYHLRTVLLPQLEIIQKLSEGNEERARDLVRQFVKYNVMGFAHGEAVDKQSEDLIESMSHVHFKVFKEQLYPVLRQKILDFASTGHKQAILKRTQEIGGFFKDLVLNAFGDQEAEDRLVRPLTPVMTLGFQDSLQLFSQIICKVANISANVTWDEGKFLEFLDTLRGILEVDAALIVASAFSGGALSAAGAPAALSTATTTLTSGLKIMNTTVGAAHHLGEILSVEEIERQMARH